MTTLSESIGQRKPNIRRRVKETPAFRADAQAKFDHLCDLIRELCAAQPYSFEGYTWAPPLSQQEWADRVGVHPRTLRRYIKTAPVVATTRGMSREKVTLLRIGQPATGQNLRKVANTLSKQWRTHMEREMTTHREYGLLFGLAEVWPEGWQPRILTHTLVRWGDFVGAAKLEMTVANASLDEDVFSPEAMADPLLATARMFPGEQFDVGRRLRHPNLGFLRKFHHVALDVFMAHRQETGQKCPPWQ
ncbi:hypothetical protein FIU89_09480 [Roseovarius sp. THAF27]|uniref:hypothetical protein n=1 Tax=Roseovarius sp. THAF27 TaxID=2587850 RepID=UPI0012679F65|nr:hypothetical protein [Roseovarius sp. THAF27]QFT80838.1 hypothetical protein FIU89_09480 [Roseovarius sp. THAF27]